MPLPRRGNRWLGRNSALLPDNRRYGNLAREPLSHRAFRIHDNCCPVSVYLAVTALKLAVFGLVVLSQRIWPFQFISATATGADR